MYFPFVGHHGGKDHQKCTLSNIERANPTVYAFWRFEEHQLYNFLCGIKDHIVPYLSTTYWLFKVFSKTKISFHMLVPHPAVCHCHLLLPGCGHLNLFFLPSDKIAIKTNWSCLMLFYFGDCIMYFCFVKVILSMTIILMFIQCNEPPGNLQGMSELHKIHTDYWYVLNLFESEESVKCCASARVLTRGFSGKSPTDPTLAPHIA